MLKESNKSLNQFNPGSDKIENPNSEIKMLFNRYNRDLNIYPFR